MTSPGSRVGHASIRTRRGAPPGPVHDGQPVSRVWALQSNCRPRWDQPDPQSPGCRHLSHPPQPTGRPVASLLACCLLLRRLGRARLEAFLKGHAVAFERLGGVPRRVRYDNLKAAVVRILAGRDRVESDRFTALRSHYGFDAFFCEPGAGGAHEKGGVEGEGGRFRRRHLVPVPRVESLAELNVLLEAADRADDARHIAGRLATVGQAAEAERAMLRALPAEPFDPTVALRAKADRKARIAVRGSRYSVPAAYAGRTVEVRLGGGTVTALAEGRVVARHERSARKGAEILVLDHYLEVLSRKPGALPGAVALAQARADGGFTVAHDRFWRRARRKLGDREGTRALVEVLLLHRRLPFIAVHAALDAVERVGSADPALVAIEARRIADGRRERAVVERPALRRFDRPAPNLAVHAALLAGSPR